VAVVKAGRGCGVHAHARVAEAATNMMASATATPMAKSIAAGEKQTLDGR